MSPEEQEHADFVPVVMARSTDEAEQYCELLSDHDIPALVGGNKADSPANNSQLASDCGMTRGVPVLVPKELLDEAGQVIADREDVDEFLVDADEAESNNNGDELGLVGDLSEGLVERVEEEDDLLLDQEVEEKLEGEGNLKGEEEDEDIRALGGT